MLLFERFVLRESERETKIIEEWLGKWDVNAPMSVFIMGLFT